MDEQEKIYNKLKYGTIFACPRCGGKRFVLETDITLCDYFELLEDGTADVQLSDLRELNHDLQDVSRVYCDECNAPIPKRKFRKIIEALGDRITYTPP